MRPSARSILLSGASLWCLAIIAAPVFDLSLVYDFFSSICHQQPMRSWHVHGEPLAVCIRCACIYFGFLAGLLAIRRPNASWFKAAVAFMAAEWLLAVTVVDLELLRAMSGILLGLSAAPIVRAGVEQMLDQRVRTAHEQM